MTMGPHGEDEDDDDDDLMTKWMTLAMMTTMIITVMRMSVTRSCNSPPFERSIAFNHSTFRLASQIHEESKKFAFDTGVPIPDILRVLLIVVFVF